jgi:hypothetical protein
MSAKVLLLAVIIKGKFFEGYQNVPIEEITLIFEHENVTCVVSTYKVLFVLQCFYFVQV